MIVFLALEEVVVIKDLKSILWIIAGTLALGLLTYVVNKFRDQIIKIVKGIFGRHMPNSSEMIATRKVSDKLAELRVALNADRAVIVQFHNGMEFAIGKRIWKLSCTHENMGDGIATFIDSLQSVYATQMYELIEPLFTRKNAVGCQRLPCWDYAIKTTCENYLKTGCPCDNPKNHRCSIFWVTIAELPHCYVRSLGMSRGIKHALICPIFSTNGSIVGYVAAHFINNIQIEPPKNYILIDEISSMIGVELLK